MVSGITSLHETIAGPAGTIIEVGDSEFTSAVVTVLALGTLIDGQNVEDYIYVVVSTLCQSSYSIARGGCGSCNHVAFANLITFI